MIIIAFVISSKRLMMIYVDCNLYRPSALRALYKSYKDTEIYALLDTIQVKYFIFCDEVEKEKNLCKRA